MKIKHKDHSLWDQNLGPLPSPLPSPLPWPLPPLPSPLPPLPPLPSPFIISSIIISPMWQIAHSSQSLHPSTASQAPSLPFISSSAQALQLSSHQPSLQN